jgi:hypothetical protein
MKYRIHIESMEGGSTSREFEIYKGNGLGGDQPGAAEAKRMVKFLFPECIVNIQVRPFDGSIWWDIDRYEQSTAEERECARSAK